VAKVLKLTPDKKAKFLEVLRAGSSITDACTALGVAYSTVRNHRLKSSSFDEQVRVAMEIQVAKVEDALFRAAIKGNVTAQIFYLINRTRFKPQEQRWQHVNHIRYPGAEGEPSLHVNTGPSMPDLSKLTVEELRMLHHIQERLSSDETPMQSGAESRADNVAPVRADSNAQGFESERHCS
jgi:hypothetical protein